MRLPPEPEICVIGAGFAGLCAGIKLKEAGFDKMTIFESNSEVGGTWLVNQYPGCACDVPSHLYSFSFAPKADWSKHYSTQPEILDYMKSVTRQYNLYPHIRFQTRVESLRWDNPSFKWIAVVYDMCTGRKETIHYDIVVNGTGMLRVPNYPEEFKDFKGELVHSAEWDPSTDLLGKRVGVVGTGASAVQIVPAVADKVDKLIVFQRRPPYIMPKLNFEYPGVAKWALTNVPGLRWATRSTIFWLQELLYLGFKHNTYGAKICEVISSVQRRSQISSDEVLRKKMTPSYEFGCKRILPSNEYYPALQKSNVDVNSSRITKVSGNRIITDDGAETELDVLILATGYKAHEYFAPMVIYGKNGEDILDTWKTEGPRTYLGTISSSMPNYFTLLGPNTGLGHSSVIFMIECQVNWMLKVLEEMQKRKAVYVNVKTEAEDSFMNWYDAGHSTTVWGNANCASWYVNPKGKIDTLYPHNLVSFWRLTGSLNVDALDFE